MKDQIINSIHWKQKNFLYEIIFNFLPEKGEFFLQAEENTCESYESKWNI